MRIRQLTKRYKKKTALANVSFEADKGNVALLGPNGAGKTTLISCIAGLITPSSGTVESDRSPNKSAIGYLPQQFSFLPNLTVGESLKYLGLLGGVSREAISREVSFIMENTNLTEYKDTLVKALSGGTLRRLGIAQALLGSPAILLLDEPTAGLDIEEREKLKALLARIKTGYLTIISTHLVEDIIGLCDRVLVLDKGHLRFDGSAEELTGFAEGRVCVSSDETPLGKGGIASGSSYYGDSAEYRFVMPQKSAEFSARPTLKEGYLALLHGPSHAKT